MLNPWNAWHPVWTHDAGMIWAWPWNRVPVFWRFMFTPGIGAEQYTTWTGEIPPVEYFKEVPR